MNVKSLISVVPEVLVRVVNEFVLVLAIAFVAALLTFLGAPAAERFNVPFPLVSAALQFAAGIITGLVAFSLMPPAVRNAPYLGIVIGFFLGGALYVMMSLMIRRTSLIRRTFYESSRYPRSGATQRLSVANYHFANPSHSPG